MREERRVPDEERLVAGIVDEVINRLHPFAADLQSFVSVAAPALGIAMGHAVGEAASRVVAQPPFAGLMAEVAALGQEPWQRRHGVDEADALLHLASVLIGVFATGRNGRLVAGDAVLVGVKPGDDRGEGGAAEAARHVAALE